MPKKIINYDETIFYKIVCNDINITECYVGHTTNFIKRKQYHKGSCNNENDKAFNYNIYKFIRENGGWENWDMVMIEKSKCENSLDAKKKEREYIEQLKASLNMNIPSRTKKEHYNDNKEFIIEKCKKYVENNKVKVAENHKKYYDEKKNISFNCECGYIGNLFNKLRHFKSIQHHKYISSM
jgi:hypothetical protein